MPIKIIADLHCDTALQINRGYDLSQRHDNYHIDLPRLKEGGVNLQVFAVFIESSTPIDKCFEATDYTLKNLKNELNRHSELIEICLTTSDIERVVASGKIAAVLAIENGMAIESSLENLNYFYEQGVRMMTLSHFRSHHWCSSSSDDKATEYGLTDFGIDVIKEMNRLGMIVDVSHISERAFYDVIETTTSPVVASHSNSYSVCAHDRNLTDKQLEALAKNGGITGVNFCSEFLSEKQFQLSKEFANKYPEKVKQLMKLVIARQPEEIVEKELAKFLPFKKAWQEAIDQTTVDLSIILDHIEYINNLIGSKHIGLGSDFDGIGHSPIGLKDCSTVKNLFKLLKDRGVDADVIDSIAGGNFMRILKQVCG